MEEIKVFESQEFGSVRCVVKDDIPWFVAKDVAEKLGYTNVSDAIKKHVSLEDRGVVKCDTPGGKQRMISINESGIYSLTMGSELESAKKFKHWITSEVLPSIRKHGVYITNEALENFISNPDVMIQALTALKEERSLRLAAEEENKKLLPKARFADAIGSCEGTILIRQLAAILTQNGFKIGEKRLFALLREKGYLSKQSGKAYNMPTQWSIEKGLFKIKETTVTTDHSSHLNVTPYVTGIGQLYFVEKFQQGVLTVPVVKTKKKTKKGESDNV